MGRTAASALRTIEPGGMRISRSRALVALCVVCCTRMPGALAAPFADKDTLKTAIRNCLGAFASGAKCCRVLILILARPVLILIIAALSTLQGADPPLFITRCDVSVSVSAGSWRNVMGQRATCGREMSTLASRRGRGHWPATRPHGLLLVSIIAACISTTHAAAFANSAALFTAVERCLSKVSTGERCCKPVSDPLGGGGADCGDAGTALMADWDTSLVTDMSGLFMSKYSFNQDISGWDVSKVTDMSDMFSGAYQFNQDLSSWKVGAVTDMSNMFSGASSFAKTADMSGWDVSKVTNMRNMFNYAQYFNATGLGSWDVSKVTDMTWMFYGASNFNDDISNWNVGQVQQMQAMFNGASIFNADITGWKPKTACTDAERNSGNCFINEGMGSQNYNFQDMFRGASQWIDSYTNCGFDNSDKSVCPASTYPSSASFYDGPPDAWTAGTPAGCSGGTASPFLSSAALIVAVERCLLKVSTGEACCSTGGANCGAACGVDMPSWDTSLVTDMSGLFMSKYSFNQDISGWDVSKVTDMSDMFSGAYQFNQDLSSWKVGAVTDMSNMFSGASSFAKTADMSGWDVSKVTNMRNMFNYAQYFNATGLGSWDVSKVTDMTWMFYGASNFNDDISNWNVGQVQQMQAMFNGASIFNADITGWKPKTACTDAERNSGNCFINEGMGSQNYNFQDMFRGASQWIDSYTNCGFDNSDKSVCPASTYPSSASFYDGPPDAWEPSICDASVAPENGAVGDCGGSLQIGDSCQPTCSSGFNPSGLRTCVRGGVLSMMLCLDTSGGPCDASAPPENGAVGTCTSSLTSGTICQPTCGVGYTVSGFSYCSGGNFTSATCAGDPCDGIPTPANGGKGNCGSSLSSGSTCRPTCKTGYTLSGDHSCDAGVLTSGTCNPDPCDASAPPTNGAAGTCTSSLASGTSCQPECNDGYFVSGPSSCLAGRLTAASCSDTLSPSPPPPSPPPKLVLDDEDHAPRLSALFVVLATTLNLLFSL